MEDVYRSSRFEGVSRIARLLVFALRGLLRTGFAADGGGMAMGASIVLDFRRRAIVAGCYTNIQCWVKIQLLGGLIFVRSQHDDLLIGRCTGQRLVV